MMKSLNNYINEKLVIDADIRHISRDRKYAYFPKDKSELIKAIEEHTKNHKVGDLIDLNDIDVWEVEDMSELFKYKSHYNYDVSKWEVDNVKNMNNMFSNLSRFECDLSGWNVANVTSMKNMFYECDSFTGKGLEKWKTNKLENMFGIFSRCTKLDVDLSNWNTSKVTNMSYAFIECSFASAKFRKSIEKWDVSSCKKFRHTFSNAGFCNIDVSNWDMKEAKEISYMFYKCNTFEGKGLEKWNVGNVEYMDSTFAGCKKLNADISGWNVRKVKTLLKAFSNCENLDCDLNKWKINKNASVSGAFENSKFETDGKLPKWYEEN